MVARIPAINRRAIFRSPFGTKFIPNKRRTEKNNRFYNARFHPKNANSEQPRTIPIEKHRLKEIAWSRDGKSIVLLIDRTKKLQGDAERLLSGLRGGGNSEWEIKLWNPRTNKEELRGCESIVGSPNGQRREGFCLCENRGFLEKEYVK